MLVREEDMLVAPHRKRTHAEQDKAKGNEEEKADPVLDAIQVILEVLENKSEADSQEERSTVLQRHEHRVPRRGSNQALREHQQLE